MGQQVKRRNPEKTQRAILTSALKHFARHGYDAAGLREIAAGAGVTAMMIKRYFGSKQALFVATLEYSMAEPSILSAKTLQADSLPHAIATALVNTFGPDKVPLDGFSVMFRSVANPTIMEIGRQVIERDRQKGLASVLEGPLAEERAAMMLAIVAGFQMLRQTAGVSALANAKPEDLVKLLTAMLDALAKPLT